MANRNPDDLKPVAPAAPGARHPAQGTGHKAQGTIRRRLPSLSFHTGQSAGELFAAASGRRSAIERGVAAHAAYEAVEWIAPDDAKTALARALVKPADLVALWRERPFELFADGEWISGRFDRVVFTGTGDSRRAVVYDFKTNRRRRDEDEATFARRLCETYAGQMRLYRRAVAALASLPADRISCRLLLVESGADVEVLSERD